MSEYQVTIGDADDPVDIAVKTLRGSDLNRYYWRMYLDKMVVLENSVDTASQLFTDWVYFKANELAKDNVPWDNQLRARCFHNFLRQMFRARYGEINFRQTPTTPNLQGTNP